MLSFREQLDNLKEQAKNGKKCEKDVKSVANEFLQEALKQLRERDCCLIRDVQGIRIRLIPSDYKDVCIDYLDHRNFFSFTLLTMECKDKEYALQVLKATQEILSEENFQIDHEFSRSFDVSF